MLVCFGCGGNEGPKDRAKVSGTVSFAGKPLQGGTINFEAADGHVGTGAIIQEGGMYSSDRVPLGTNYVTVETESLKYGNAAAYVKIPTKYNDPQTSRLTVEIKPGDNTDVNFELTE